MTKINYILAALFILSTANASSSGSANALPEENKLKWNKERMDAISALCECYNTSQDDEKTLKECLTAIPGKNEKICENISAHFKELRNKKKFKNSSLSTAKNRIEKLKTIFDECSKSSDENEIIDMECLNQKITFSGLAANNTSTELRKQLNVLGNFYFPTVNAPNITTNANVEITDPLNTEMDTIVSEPPAVITMESSKDNTEATTSTGANEEDSTKSENTSSIDNESQPPFAESKCVSTRGPKSECFQTEDSDLVIESNPAEGKDNSLFADSKDNVKNLTKTGAGTPDTFKETGIAKDQTLHKIDIGIVVDHTSKNVGETDESGAPKNPTKTGTEDLKTETENLTKTGTEDLKTGTDDPTKPGTPKSQSETKESETTNDLKKAQTANNPTKTVTKTGLDETNTISTDDPEVEDIPETESDSDNDNESIIKVICLKLIEDPVDDYLPTDSESDNESLQGTDNNPKLNQPSSGSKQPENLTNNGTQNVPKKTVTPKYVPATDKNKTPNDPIKTGTDDLETETPEGSNNNESGSSPNVETSIFLGVPAIISYCVIILLSVAGVFYYMNSKRPEEL